ncbi:MAG: putative quinol monooxygenase [Rhizobiaceae bacterium]
MIHLIATLTIQPGALEKVVAAAQPCIDATRKEEGCISYDLLVDVTDKKRLKFVECWENRAALDAHFETPHLQAWRKAGGQFFTSRHIEIISDGKVEVL